MNNFKAAPYVIQKFSNFILKPRCFFGSSRCSSIAITSVSSSSSLESSFLSYLPLCRSLIRNLTVTSSGATDGPASIDYRSLLEEDAFHKLANNTIFNLQEKIEEYGDSVRVDGFDVEYSNEVLTVKLGNIGTYVLNKQTPNRQLWLSSPVSGPSRYDWDADARSWIYRRTGDQLLRVLENEFVHLCGESIDLD